MDTNEKLEQYINNQRKGNRFTLIAVIIFIGLAVSTIILGTELSKTEKDLEIAYQQLKDSSDKLSEIATEREREKLTLNNQLKDKYLADSLYFFAKYAGITLPEVPATPSSDIPHNEPEITVYIQFQQELKKEKDLIAKKLRRDKKYRVPIAEMVDISYEKEIRYFNTQDQKLADELLSILGSEYHIVWVEHLKSPLNQLEVWIGNPKQMNIQQQYNRIKKKAM